MKLGTTAVVFFLSIFVSSCVAGTGPVLNTNRYIDDFSDFNFYNLLNSFNLPNSNFFDLWYVDPYTYLYQSTVSQSEIEYTTFTATTRSISESFSKTTNQEEEESALSGLPRRLVDFESQDFPSFENAGSVLATTNIVLALYLVTL